MPQLVFWPLACGKTVKSIGNSLVRFIIKLLISVGMIILCSQIGRKLPTLGGLLAVMPLTGLIVLLWLYSDNPGNFDIMTAYAKGALWGIIPSTLFFAVAFVCFRRHLPLWKVLCASFTVWIVAAAVHQLVLGESEKKNTACTPGECRMQNVEEIATEDSESTERKESGTDGSK